MRCSQNSLASLHKKQHNMGYLYLTLAIVAEVIATSALKQSVEFTRVVPSTISILGYCCAFYLLSLVLRTIPVGVSYAIWSGVGMVLITIIGRFYFKQLLDAPALIGIALIIVGVVTIGVFSKSFSA
jgi:small multidrug resistance pump